VEKVEMVQVLIPLGAQLRAQAKTFREHIGTRAAAAVLE